MRHCPSTLMYTQLCRHRLSYHRTHVLRRLVLVNSEAGMLRPPRAYISHIRDTARSVDRSMGNTKDPQKNSDFIRPSPFKNKISETQYSSADPSSSVNPFKETPELLPLVRDPTYTDDEWAALRKAHAALHSNRDADHFIASKKDNKLIDPSVLSDALDSILEAVSQSGMALRAELVNAASLILHDSVWTKRNYLTVGQLEALRDSTAAYLRPSSAHLRLLRKVLRVLYFKRHESKTSEDDLAIYRTLLVNGNLNEALSRASDERSVQENGSNRDSFDSFVDSVIDLIHDTQGPFGVGTLPELDSDQLSQYYTFLISFLDKCAARTQNLNPVTPLIILNLAETIVQNYRLQMTDNKPSLLPSTDTDNIGPERPVNNGLLPIFRALEKCCLPSLEAERYEACTLVLRDILKNGKTSRNDKDTLDFLEEVVNVCINEKGATEKKLVAQATHALVLQTAIVLRCPIEFAKPIFKSLLLGSADPYRIKETYDCLFLWAIYASDREKAIKAIGDITKKLRDVESNDEVTLIDTNLINKGLDLALSLNKDSKVTELLINSYSIYNLDKDADSFALLIDKALKDEGLEESQELFEEAKNNGIQWGPEQRATIMRLASRQATKPGSSSDAIVSWYLNLRVYYDAIDDDVLLEFASAFLKSNSPEDLQELMRLELGDNDGYNLEIKQTPHTMPALYGLLLRYVLEPGNPVSTAWRVYTLLMRHFRVPLVAYPAVISRFCFANRPDAAEIIFNHVKDPNNLDGQSIPEELYIHFLREYGRCGYAEGVSEVQRVLAMDMSLKTLSVDLLNGLMYAHGQCNDQDKAIDTWNQLLSGGPKAQLMGQGPNEESVSVILGALSTDLVKEIALWESLPGLGITPTAKNAALYVSAWAQEGSVIGAQHVIESLPDSIMKTPTESSSIISRSGDGKTVLIALYNNIHDAIGKRDVYEWAINTYPQLWKSVLESGKLSHRVRKLNGATVDYNLQQLIESPRDKLV